MDIEIFNPLKPYLHSSNNLGDIYHLPNDGSFIIDEFEIMKTFIGCQINYKPNIIEVIVIHKTAFHKN